MIIAITVKPNARKPKVEKLPDGTLLVAVNAPAHEGKANAAVIAALAEHYGIRKSAIRIVRGHKGKKKFVELSVDTD